MELRGPPALVGLRIRPGGKAQDVVLEKGPVWKLKSLGTEQKDLESNVQRRWRRPEGTSSLLPCSVHLAASLVNATHIQGGPTSQIASSLSIIQTTPRQAPL